MGTATALGGRERGGSAVGGVVLRGGCLLWQAGGIVPLCWEGRCGSRHSWGPPQERWLDVGINPSFSYPCPLSMPSIKNSSPDPGKITG